MTADQALAFLLFAVTAAITPGPSNVMLTAAGAAGGVLRGLPCLLGVGLGMGLLIFSAAGGLGQLVVGRPLALKLLNWLGAGFLLWLAWRIATARPAGEGAAEAKPVGFLAAAAFQWVNPKSWLVAAAAVGAHLQPEAGATGQAAWLAALFVAAALPSGLAWLAFGAAMRRLLASPSAARRFNLAMGLCLAASVALILR